MCVLARQVVRRRLRVQGSLLFATEEFVVLCIAVLGLAGRRKNSGLGEMHSGFHSRLKENVMGTCGTALPFFLDLIGLGIVGIVWRCLQQVLGGYSRRQLNLA